MTLQKTASEWNSLITDYHKSKKSITAFCQSRAISFHAFYHQLRISRGDAKTKRGSSSDKSSAAPSTSAFIEITDSRAAIVLRLRNNRSLEIPSDFSEREVRRLIAVLESC